MKLLLAAAAAAVTLGAAGAASAQALPGFMSPVSPYLNLGYGSYQVENDNLPSVGAGIVRGGLRFGRNVGVELEGSMGLDTEDTDFGTTAELDSQYAAYIVGIIPATDRVDLFARVGLGRAQYDPDTAANDDPDDVDTINYGLGIQGFFTPHLGARADYTRIDNRDNGIGQNALDADVFSIALVWRLR